MLILEARHRKLLMGICSDKAKVLHKKELRNIKEPVLPLIQSFLNSNNINLRSSKVALTLAPCDPLTINPILSFLSQQGVRIRPVHHLEAHFSFCRRPFIGLIGTQTSTELVLHTQKSFKLLGIDIDIPLGEVFFKLSKELNVPLHKWENVSESETIPYPSAMKSQESLDFSFAGSYFYTLQHLYPRSHYLPLTSPLLDPCFHRSNPKTAEILINSFQAAVEEQVSDRVTKALRYVKENHPIVKTFVRPKQAFTGGISSNQRLSLKLKELCNAFDFQYMQKNEKDSIEMIRDLIFFKKCNLLNPQNLSAYKNYALGPYTFLTL